MTGGGGKDKLAKDGLLTVANTWLNSHQPRLPASPGHERLGSVDDIGSGRSRGAKLGMSSSLQQLLLKSKYCQCTDGPS